jgi:acyl-CoA synthetase (AMP-forming)/AMP-acid ligase II
MPDPADPSRTIFRSGDLGRLHPDGQLEYIGRKDFQVKIRGFSVDLSAIENVLMSDEGVHRAVVAAPADTEGQRRLVAYVLPARGVELSVKRLRDLVSTTLPAYMVPALIEIVSELEMGSRQKVDRTALPRRS